MDIHTFLLLNTMNVHFIAIGGAAMHNMALALQHKHYHITGSDDEINEPSRSRLEKAGLLPSEMGWFPEKITTDLDAVILGMHARADNPELLRAKELGVKVYSYPEYLYEQSKNKKRLVIGGSHGKTSITAMVLHVLQAAGLDFDYMVGSQLSGFERMVRLSEEAPIIVLEGDEYLSSPIDRRPKFHLYKADIALLSGIAWDHINVFPTFENYVDQFQIYVDQLPEDGALIYCNDDLEVRGVCEKAAQVKARFPYTIPPHHIDNGITILDTKFGPVALEIFGDHNLLNLEGARLMCQQVGVGDELFYKSIATFKGAARRLELIGNSNNVRVYKDFAHSPSKLIATTNAVKQQFKNRRVIACMELHTFSSLNAEFLDHYKNSMNEADLAIVYYNPQTIAHKKLPPITHEQVKKAFAREDLLVMSDSTELKNYLKNFPFQNDVLLLMSSGTFDGLDLESLARS